MQSRRLPQDGSPNPWSRLLAERRAAGADLLDLTEANPTRVGLGGAGPEDLAALADPASATYEPDARGSDAARQAVAAYHRDRGVALDPGHVVLTAGTSEAYAHLFRLLADPGDTILAPAPSYPLFEPLAALEGVEISHYRLAWDGRWHLDLDSLEVAMEQPPRAMIVVQPNHPTGSCLEEAELTAVERLCERHGVALISDEVFSDFPFLPQRARDGREGGSGAESGDRPPARPAPLPTLLGARRVPTFVLSGISKVCGMPQLKLSWIAVAGPEPARTEALEGLEWIADLFLSVGTPIQQALPRLLAGRHGWQAAVRTRIGANLEQVRSLAARDPRIELRTGQGGWVAMLRVPEDRGEEAWVLELLRRDVIVHPGHFYDAGEEAHVVVSLIVPPDRFAEGLVRIEALAAEG